MHPESNLHWFKLPEFSEIFKAKHQVPEKWRVTVDCSGYEPKHVHIELKHDKLVVWGREESSQEVQDPAQFHVKTFKRMFDIPPNAVQQKYTSFMTPDGKLIVEMPLAETETRPHDHKQAKFERTLSGNETVSVSFRVPQGIDPAKVNISVKDNNLVMHVEDEQKTQDSMYKVHLYRRTSMPPNTDFEGK